jgi:hypothetical protein
VRLAILLFLGVGLLCGLFAIVVGATVGISPWAWPLAVFGVVGCATQIAWWARL